MAYNFNSSSISSVTNKRKEAVTNETKISKIISKLNAGIPFGLFNDGKDCYFQDGEKVNYSDLWMALKELHKVDPSTQTKTLYELCSNTYEGYFNYKYSRHKWKNRK